MLAMVVACGDDGGPVTAQEFCTDYREAAEATADPDHGPDLNFLLDWTDDNGGNPARAAIRARRFAMDACPEVADDPFLLSWLAELDIDPDLPPVVERDVTDATP